jgi:ABC-type multidrug transport system permease subunit
MEVAWKGLLLAYKASEAHDDVSKVLLRDMRPQFQANKLRPMGQFKVRKFNSTTWQQILLCTQRQWQITVRNKAVMFTNYTRSIILGLMLGSLVYMPGNHQADARIRFGLLFFIVGFVASVANQLIPVIIRQRDVFYNQNNAGYYHSVAYFVANLVVQIPLSASETLLFSVVVYPLCGLRGTVFITSYFWYFWLLLFALSMCAKSFALMITSMSPTPAVAMAAAPILQVLFITFCGFMVPFSSIPVGW